MSKEETLRRAAIMQAVEWNDKGEATNLERKDRFEISWRSVTAPYWNWVRFDYRIIEEPKLVPLDRTDELVGKIVRSKGNDNRYLIGNQIERKVYLCGVGCISYKDLFINYVFPDGSRDGSPCGKMEPKQ